ncbi:MAG: hypothetical protein HOC27_00360 [Phycisphaerae bacterium]|nr:hypothetical protein [Phycisphaerae bacterium]
MNIPHITYEAWEPMFAKEKLTKNPWRLDYCGAGEWKLYVRTGVWYHTLGWVLKASGDIDSLSEWAREHQLTRKHDRSLYKRLGIRLSGSYETRLRNLRGSLIYIGCGQQSTTEGGIGTSFVCTTDVTAYAELGNNGGIDVWVRKTRPFSSESELVYCASDLTAMGDIENALREEEIYPQCRKNQELLEMIDSIWSSPIRSSEKQTYIPKPKGRPHGCGELVCTHDHHDDSIDWSNYILYELPVPSICDSMEEIRERGLSVNWHELLEGQKDLMPKLWNAWDKRCKECQVDYESWAWTLMADFPGIYCESETFGATMMMSTEDKWYVRISHKDWLISCFEFVAERLKLFVEKHDNAT